MARTVAIGLGVWLLLLAVGPQPVSGDPREARAGKCRPGTVTVRIDGRKSCRRASTLGLPRRRLGDVRGKREAARLIARPGFFAGLVGDGPLAAVARETAPARRDLLEQMALPSFLAPPGARASRPLMSEPVRSFPPAGSVGGTVRTAGTISLGDGTIDGQGVDIREIAECPEPGGTLPGRFKFERTTTVTQKLDDGGRAEVFMTLGTDARITAHVNDKAEVEHYGYVSDTLVSVKGTVYGPGGDARESADVTHNVRTVVGPLKPGHTVRDDGAMRVIAARGLSVLAPGARENALDAGFWIPAALVPMAMDTLVPRASHVFDDRAACLTARFEPASFKPVRGRAKRLAVTVVDREGRRVAMPLSGRGDPGTVKPGRDATTRRRAARFRLTPPRRGPRAGLSVEGRSNRGRVEGSLIGRLGEPSLPRAYAGDVHATLTQRGRTDTYTATGIVFRRVSGGPGPDGEGYGAKYDLAQGQVVWEMTETTAQCTIKAGPRVTVAGPDPVRNLTGDLRWGRPAGGRWAYGGFALVGGEPRPTATAECGGSRRTYPTAVPGLLLKTAPAGGGARFGSPKRAITGENTETTAAGVLTMRWSFRPR